MSEWSIAACEKRLQKIYQECLLKNSTEPVDKFFQELAEYAKREGEAAEPNIIRIHQLWDRHYDQWYMRLREEEQEQEYAF